MTEVLSYGSHGLAQAFCQSLSYNIHSGLWALPSPPLFTLGAALKQAQ